MNLQHTKVTVTQFGPTFFGNLQADMGFILLLLSVYKTFGSGSLTKKLRSSTNYSE